MNIYKGLARIALKLHNFFYGVSSFLAIKAEHGLHPKHRLIGYHAFFVNNVRPEDVVLDIGCGNGALTADVAKKAKRVVGIDFSEANIATAKRKYSAQNTEYICQDAVKNLPAGTFDVIILSNVLEHIEDRAAFLRGLKNRASKFLIRVPMVNRDWITLYKKELGVEYRLDTTHFIEYTMESFQDELEKAGFAVYNHTIQFGEIWAIIQQK
ncbi:MAG: class I SAM-dependent methyltransferase [bacterium]|nr:class I SAM-dependent methyltransferase [bacterium]